MGNINVSRWLAGGFAAGALIWVLEGAASVLYMDQMEAALAAHSLSLEMSPGVMAATIAVSLLMGLALVFFYALARSRMGPGPRTAVTVAVALFAGSTLIALIGYRMLGLFPDRMLVTWGIIGIGEMILGGLLGGWIYREL